MKPDARIYQIALERSSAQPAEAIFVDDFEHNIVAAQALGITTVHYQDPAQARQALITLSGVS
jgi:HAD superfamily hydrolase (TIGR01509 family)